MDKTLVRILGIRIDMVDYESTLSLIKKQIVKPSFGNYICVCNVHVIMLAQKDYDLKNALDHSTLTVADGMPVVWSARKLGASINATVRGTNLMLKACEMAESERYSVFFYGAKPQTLSKMQENLLRRFPRLRISGVYSPPFSPLSEEEDAQIIEMINSASPDILFIGLGAPKQEKWMADYCQKIKVPVTIGVGAAFDFLSGEKKQAPVWMQARGLEWLFRLVNEPSRLWARYIVYNPQYVFLVIKQLLREKLFRTRLT
jgi:N-acetylglucosaminyldiphosphoundecaprenol N-acetyl-beta-D-mannosaminyltransferase